MGLFGRSTPADERRAQAYRHWLQQRNPCAIASLVLGIFSLIEFGALLVVGMAGIALGVIALRQLARQAGSPSPGATCLPPEPAIRPAGRGLAWAGIALSVLSLAMAALIYAWPRAH